MVLMAAPLLLGVVTAVFAWWITRRRRRSGDAEGWWKNVERVTWLFTLVLSPISFLVAVVTPFVTWGDSTSNTPAVTESSHAGPSGRNQPSTKPLVALTDDNFSLGPPSAFLNLETDKIDLDTGERGYGQVVEQWGVDSQPDNGRRTDVIIEETEIHAFSGGDRVLALLSGDGGGEYYACLNALADDSRRTARIPLRDLNRGSRLCVETDEERVALITIKAVSAGPVLTVSYITWESA